VDNPFGPVTIPVTFMTTKPDSKWVEVAVKARVLITAPPFTVLRNDMAVAGKAMDCHARPPRPSGIMPRAENTTPKVFIDTHNPVPGRTRDDVASGGPFAANDMLMSH